MTGGNVTNDFLDNLAANQYLKMHQPKKMNITPQIYIDMNKEFEEEGTAVRIEVPTQEAIDKWLNHKEDIHKRTTEPVDMVAELWRKHREENDN